MPIRIEVVPWLTRVFDYTGSGRLILERPLAAGATLGDVLGDLVREHPALAGYALAGDGTLRCPHICVTLDGQVVAVPAELVRPLRDGAVLVLLPAFAGG